MLRGTEKSAIGPICQHQQQLSYPALKSSGDEALEPPAVGLLPGSALSSQHIGSSVGVNWGIKPAWDGDSGHSELCQAVAWGVIL